MAREVNIYRIKNIITGEVKEGTSYKLSIEEGIYEDAINRAWRRGESKCGIYEIEFIGIKQPGKKELKILKLENNSDPNIDEACILATKLKMTYGRYMAMLRARDVKVTYDIYENRWVETV